MLCILSKEPLKILRVRANLTQKQLGEKVGMTGEIISHYEKDVNNLRKAQYGNIEKLAFALGVSVDDIFLG
ncbi:helix-turn-helix transcriptional regulator [Sporosarcina sp. CAU 1771]